MGTDIARSGAGQLVPVLFIVVAIGIGGTSDGAPQFVDVRRLQCSVLAIKLCLLGFDLGLQPLLLLPQQRCLPAEQTENPESQKLRGGIGYGSGPNLRPQQFLPNFVLRM